MFHKIIHIFLPLLTILFVSRKIPVVTGILRDSNIGDKMTEMGIYPHIVPSLPSQRLRIIYDNGTERLWVQESDGDSFSDYATRDEPEVLLRICNTSRLYILFMTFVKIPNSSCYERIKPERLNGAKQYHHWIRYNIPGCEEWYGDDLFEYKPPLEIVRDEYRLYVFLMFLQNDEIYVDLEERYRFYFFRDEFFHDSHRQKFTVKEFLEYYDIGELVAANFFHQRYPSSDERFFWQKRIKNQRNRKF